jgi:hypothetical protein
MTPDELKCLDLLGEAWNAFVALPIEHESDHREFQHHLHVLQRHIMARSVRRDLQQ